MAIPRKAHQLTLVLTFVFGLLVPCAVRAQARSSRGRWQLSLDAQAGFPVGYVRVGENGGRRDRLDFHDDLGVDSMEALDLGIGYAVTPLDELRFSFQMLFLEGSTRLDGNVFFNNTEMLAGTHLDTSASFPDFWRATLTYERSLLPSAEPTRLTGIVGLTWVDLVFRLDGTVAPDSPGNESKERFNRQELPVPLLGLRLEHAFTHRLGLTVSASGGYLPWVDSLRKEGGTVDLTQAHADLSLGLRYALLPSLTLEAGPRYSYFMQHEKSHQDDNFIQISQFAGFLRLTKRF